MQKILKLQLIDKPTTRFFVNEKGYDLECLFDTGASISVWCNSIDMLKVLYPEAAKTKYKTVISGFGGNKETNKSLKAIDIWVIPSFKIKGLDGNLLEIRNFCFAIQYGNATGCDFVLSCTLLGKCNYTIVNNNSNTRSRYLLIKYDKDFYFISVSMANNLPKKAYSDMGIVKSTYAFSQEELQQEQCYKYICIKRIECKNQKIYIITDINGVTKELAREDILNYLENGVQIKNLKLTTNGRILFKRK